MATIVTRTGKGAPLSFNEIDNNFSNLNNNKLENANNLSDVNDVATARTNLDVPTRAGGNASGSWNINSASATKLQTARTINGLPFDGTANINIPIPDEIPSGTKMLFQQSAAPTGWTKDTVHNNKALRVVSGTAGSGGTVAFSTAFANKTVTGSIGATTLTTAQMPSHGHTYFSPQGNTQGTNRYQTQTAKVQGTTPSNATTVATGSGGSHTHSFTGTAINLAVQYVDLIIATKN